MVQLQKAELREGWFLAKFSKLYSVESTSRADLGFTFFCKGSPAENFQIWQNYYDRCRINSEQCCQYCIPRVQRNKWGKRYLEKHQSKEETGFRWNFLTVLSILHSTCLEERFGTKVFFGRSTNLYIFYGTSRIVFINSVVKTAFNKSGKWFRK